MLILKNQLLEIEICEPGELYNSTRFDWTGLISQVTLENKHTFCTNETTIPTLRSEKGIGLCHEFGISTPVGYAECPMGQYFLKIGTGKLLKDTDGDYDFFKKYNIIPAEFKTVSVSGSECVLFASDNDTRGYSYTFSKKYQLFGNKLKIQCLLKNNGSKKIITEEYCHNFMALDNLAVNNYYTLEFDTHLYSTFEHTVNPSLCTIISKNGISWQSVPESDFFFSKIGAMKSWTIKNFTSGTYVTEKVHFTPVYCNLWGKGHVISPELFFHINLNAGEEISWEREYEFGFL